MKKLIIAVVAVCLLIPCFSEGKIKESKKDFEASQLVQVVSQVNFEIQALGYVHFEGWKDLLKSPYLFTEDMYKFSIELSEGEYWVYIKQYSYDEDGNFQEEDLFPRKRDQNPVRGGGNFFPAANKSFVLGGPAGPEVIRIWIFSSQQTGKLEKTAL